MANNIVATWGFKRKLPEPFEDYTDHAIFDDIASKYCTQPRKKSTLQCEQQSRTGLFGVFKFVFFRCAFHIRRRSIAASVKLSV